MNNNDVLRRIRYTFDLNDRKMIELFSKGEKEVTRAEISDWLKKDDDENFKEISDKDLAIFLNGFIIEKRGEKDGKKPIPEEKLNNNILLRKLKIALNLKSEDVLEILMLGGANLSKHELSAFFRKPFHKHYMECQDQIFRKFLKGLQIKYRTE